MKKLSQWWPEKSLGRLQEKEFTDGANKQLVNRR
jgi:hypothetical protein